MSTFFPPFKNLFNLSVSSAELEFSLDGAEHRPTRPIVRFDHCKRGKAKELPLFRENEDIRGLLTSCGDRHAGSEFLNLWQTLQSSGNFIQGDETFAFDFSNVDKADESYYGHSVNLRYVLRATLSRGNYASNLVHEQDVWVQRVTPPPPVDTSIKMEVGIEDCLHIEFEYGKSKYHLEDVVIGKIFFLLVRIKITHMELAILRRESVGSGTHRHSESDTITKFEIMDGAPVKNESVPVRLYLAPYALTPTYRNVQNRFSVKYFLNLVLVDEGDRRYFKQQEITLWRKTFG
ncbi:unnamed protein product [Peronospora destructor]|uniref:Vacuolar protein sorting-associated protein 26 n=1 Tax=Peronospora destructor TaxID=86335 RepID=A0AAV0TLN2_9STRA|nr:unnamed protein product [Peronospora destructor]